MTLLSEIHVSVDIGYQQHSVAIGLASGELLDEFDIAHRPEGFADFFARIEKAQVKHGGDVTVAMEGYNGYARPLDRLVQDKHYRLLNINNLKLARWSVLERDANQYQLLIDRSLHLFGEFYDLDNAANHDFMTQLQELQKMVIKPEKPDITGSLRELQRILSQRAVAPQPGVPQPAATQPAAPQPAAPQPADMPAAESDNG